MAEDVKKEDKPQEDWMTKKWRPMMAVMYMSVCIFDFILFPIMFTLVQFWEVQAANDAFRQWNPITLGGGGLFHVAMGAVLGVTAWSRGQEKMAGVASAPSINNGVQSIQMSYAPTQQRRDPVLEVVPVNVGFGGKAAPPPAPQPLI